MNLGLLASLPLLAASLQAQIRIDAEYTAISWPSPSASAPTFAGPDRAMICGQFVPGHLGPCAVVVRDQHLYMSFQPLMFPGIMAAGAPTVLAGSRSIAALRRNDDADLVAALEPGGLRIWGYDPAIGFDPVAASASVNGDFAGATRLDTGTHIAGGGATEHHVIASNTSWVRCATMDSSLAVTAAPIVSMAAGVTLFDARAIDWVAGGLPEVALLTSTGVVVIDHLGNPLAVGVGSGSPTEGHLITMRNNSAPMICVATHGTGSWNLSSWVAGSSSGTLTMASAYVIPGTGSGSGVDVTGLDKVDLVDDAMPEVVVSCTDSLRRVFFGSTTGPAPHSAGAVEIEDVDPASLPVTPLANNAPARFYDIDRNGNVDMVIPSTASDELVIIHDILPQVQWILLSNDTDGTLTGTVSDPRALGRIDDAGGWAFDVHAEHDNDDGLALRLTLPSGVTADHALQVYSYDLVNGVPQLSTVDAFKYPLASDFQAVDFVVPVPVSTSSMMFEVNLVGENGLQGQSTMPVLLRYDYNSTAYIKFSDLLPDLPSNWLTVTPLKPIYPQTLNDWWDADYVSLRSFGPGTLAGSQRFIGYITHFPLSDSVAGNPDVDAIKELLNQHPH
ncbi:MAG: hypothetical protein AB8H80_19350 [Planctomycetota bacterium]